MLTVNATFLITVFLSLIYGAIFLSLREDISMQVATSWLIIKLLAKTFQSPMPRETRKYKKGSYFCKLSLCKRCFNWCHFLENRLNTLVLRLWYHNRAHAHKDCLFYLLQILDSISV